MKELPKALVLILELFLTVAVWEGSCIDGISLRLEGHRGK